MIGTVVRMAEVHLVATDIPFINCKFTVIQQWVIENISVSNNLLGLITRIQKSDG